MKIINLITTLTVYTSNVYLVLGSWNALQDMNTLVDAGRDPAVLATLETMNTGVGKRKVDQIVLTHSHYDHATNAIELKKKYHVPVKAFSKYMPDVDVLLSDGMSLQFGDQWFEVLHTPGHTGDSICFFCRSEGVLFSGDSAIRMEILRDGTKVIYAGDRLIEGVKMIYPGHGNPLSV